MPDHIIFAPIRTQRRYAKPKRTAVHLNGAPWGASLALVGDNATYVSARLDDAAIRELVAGLLDITMKRAANEDMRRVVVDYHHGDGDAS